MKQRLTTISVLLAVGASLLLGQSSGRVEGIVVDSATGAGIPGVSVYFGTDDGTHYETTTVDAGAFRIEGMKPGKYGSHYEKAGYLPYYSGQDPAASLAQVSSGGNPHPIRIQLSAPATLTGRVVDPDGKPAPARVDLDLLKEAVTDQDGRFLFTGLAPGEHTLLATPMKSTATREARTLLVPTWFPSTIDADQAQKIAVTSGAAVSDIEIRLQRTRVYRVQGTVLSAAGKPMTQTTVMMASGARHETLTGMVQKGDIAFFPLGIPGPAVSHEGISSARTNEGTFEFPAVPAGDWRFVAFNDGRDQPSGPPSFATVPFFVGHDVDDLQIRFAAPFQWKGSVEWLGSSDSKPAAKLTVMLAAEDDWLAGGGNGADGILHFDNVRPGQYRIVPPPGTLGNYYLSSALVGEREVLGQPVQLFPGSPPLRVLYKPNAGTVRGTVDNCEAGTLVLAPERALTDLTQDFGRFSSCGSAGEFSIGSLRPDDYYIWAVDTADPKKFADAKILQKLIPEAVRVTVAEGETASVHLSVTHVE
jgi:Carboxypeptidase regulatory-like domain